MASHQPAQLAIGTEVSARFNGAFCESKITKILVKNIKVKVTLTDRSVVEVTDEHITSGALKVGTNVLLKHPTTTHFVEGVIKKVQDDSVYEVSYPDGDKLNLKRSGIFPKGDKHFDESENLDNLPLSNPEHFGTPVLKKSKGMRGKSKNDSEKDDSGAEDDQSGRESYPGRNQDLVGEVMLLDGADRRKEAPVLVVLPDASSSVQCKNNDQVLVRSFKDSKFMVVTASDLKEFNPDSPTKNEDKTNKTALERAQQWVLSSQLPSAWNREELLGPLQESDDASEVRSEEFDDEEQSEENDRFVAQLYKFMDDRSTPLVKNPSLGNKDLNLYRLFKVVQNLGGFNKVGTRNNWKEVYDRMGLPPCPNPGPQIKNAYKRYLHAFEDFYRKLGSSMGTLSRPGRLSRQSTSRGILSFRIRDKDSSPHSPRPEKSTPKEDKSKEAEKSKAKVEEPPAPTKTKDSEDSESTATMEESDSEVIRRSTPRREKAQKEEPKSDKKDDGKAKKEEEKKEESPSKEDRKKEDASKKREERKSLRQKEKDDDKKDNVKTTVKEEEKKEVKKEDGKPARILRKDLNEKEEDSKKEQEDLKKRVTRRKSNRSEEEKKDEEGEDEEKEDEKKKDKKEKKPLPPKDKGGPKAKVNEDEKTEEKEKESEEEDDEASNADSQDHEELPLGTRLRVRYGRGRNQKIYEAKIVEHGTDGAQKTYLVHYAGWNVRFENGWIVPVTRNQKKRKGDESIYDEWIKTDRIVAVVEKPETPGVVVSKPKKISSKLPTPAKPPSKGSSTPPQVKSETAVTKKRGRQSSIQQAPSPGGSSTKSFGANDTPKTPKTKSARDSPTVSSSASKTRSTRSNSTELRIEPGLSKSRITRRSSGINDSMNEPNASEMDVASESDLDSEAAQVSASGEEVGSVREEDDATKDSEMDISLEEQPYSPSKKDTDMDSSLGGPPEEDFGAVKSQDSSAMQEEAEREVMPTIVPVSNLEQPKASALSESATTVDDGNSSKSNSKDVAEAVKELPVLQEPVSALPAEEKEAEKKEEKKEIVVKEELLSEASEEVKPLQSLPAAEPKPETEKSHLPVDDPTIPQLKKIDLDLPPDEDKKDGKEKEKLKVGKKQGRETKKSRQNDMRSSFSEIPTLEPMTSPGDSKTASDVSPSPYDFNDIDADSPGPTWQPDHHITKKWEPNNRLLPPHRDVKMELKKSLETEKKKVKKKAKKVAEEGTGEMSTSHTEGESPTKPAAMKTKEPSTEEEVQPEKPPMKKKGRKKKGLEGDTTTKLDTSSYEETVNSVVESCKADAALLDDLPSPNVSELKEEKPAKKRKSKVLDASVAPAKGSEGVGEESGKKTGKGLKGKVGRKKKDLKNSDSASEQSSVLPVSQNFADTFLIAGCSLASEKVDGSETVKAVPCKVPRVEMDPPSGAFVSVGIPVGPSVSGPSTSSASTPSQVGSSTSGGSGSDRLAPSLEGGSDSKPNVPPRAADLGAEAPKAACSGTVRNTVLNTPPTTPENDTDEANSASSSSDNQDNLKEDSLSLDSGERTSKRGSESPTGCDFSLSSTSSENLPSSSSGAQASSKPSNSSENVSPKRKRKDDSGAPPRKRKRQFTRVTRSERGKNSPRYGDEDSQSRSPMHHNGIDASSMAATSSEPVRIIPPRQPKFHFADDLGLHLKGEARITFLLEKMKEIRKTYQGVKSEMAMIERKRKRARRREKERESSQASAGEKDNS